MPAGLVKPQRTTLGTKVRRETRQQRIEEFFVHAPGLREGAWLWVCGRQAVLAGGSTDLLFLLEVGHHRAADVVLREPIELPQQGFAGVLQIAVKVRFLIRSGHADSLPPQLRRPKISADSLAPP